MAIQPSIFGDKIPTVLFHEQLVLIHILECVSEFRKQTGLTGSHIWVEHFYSRNQVTKLGLIHANEIVESDLDFFNVI